MTHEPERFCHWTPLEHCDDICAKKNERQTSNCLLVLVKTPEAVNTKSYSNTVQLTAYSKGLTPGIYDIGIAAGRFVARYFRRCFSPRAFCPVAAVCAGNAFWTSLRTDSC